MMDPLTHSTVDSGCDRNGKPVVVWYTGRIKAEPKVIGS